jgi:hypothetical protein
MDFIKNKFNEIKNRKASRRIVVLIIAAVLSGIGLSSDVAKDVAVEISELIDF